MRLATSNESYKAQAELHLCIVEFNEHDIVFNEGDTVMIMFGLCDPNDQYKKLHSRSLGHTRFRRRLALMHIFWSYLINRVSVQFFMWQTSL